MSDYYHFWRTQREQTRSIHGVIEFWRLKLRCTVHLHGSYHLPPRLVIQPGLTYDFKRRP